MILHGSSKSVFIQGERLYFHEIGEGKPIVLLHAGVADSRMWEPQISALGGEYHLIVPDLRGFGQSPYPDGPFSYHADIAGIINELQLDDVVLVGTSFGGRVAIDFCLAYPTFVKSLIIVSPLLDGLPMGKDIEAFNEEEDKLVEQGDIRATTELNLKMWVDGPQRTPADVDTDVRALVAEMQFHAFEVPEPDGVEITRLNPPAGQRLKEILKPVLVVAGKLDVETVVHQARLIASEINHSWLEIAPDAAHMLSMEKPEWFNVLVREFISEVKAEH